MREDTVKRKPCTTDLLTAQVGGQLVQGDVLQEVGSQRQRGEVLEDEAVHEGLQALQAVEESQLLQVQVVVLAHLHLQVLAAEVHRLAHLHSPIGFDIHTAGL